MAGSGLIVTSLKSGQVVAKVAHRADHARSLGTGRALNSDEMVCLDVAVAPSPSSSNESLQQSYKIATGWIDGAVRLFEVSMHDILQGQTVAHSVLDDSDRNEVLQRQPLLLQGHANPVRTVQFDGASGGGGDRLASGGSDGAVVVWDVVSETGLFRLVGHRGAVTDLSFVALGNATTTRATERLDLLVSSSLDGLVKIWDLHAQCCTQTIASHHPLASVCRKSFSARSTTTEDDDQERWRRRRIGRQGRCCRSRRWSQRR